MEKPIAVIALGANLGDREATLREALRRLESAGMRLLRTSRFIETAPVGYVSQPDFLNAVAALEIPASVSPEQLLALLLETEKSLGRKRPFPNAPRTCDLDLIFFESEQRDAKEFILPHPRWRERAFVVVPLHDILEQAASDGNAWTGREPWKSLRNEVREVLARSDCSGIRKTPQ